MRIAGDVEAEESDTIICNGKKYLSDICYVIISTRGNVVLYLVYTMFVRRTEKRLLNLNNPSFNAYDDFTFIFPGKPQSLCVCAGLFCPQTTFARGVSFDMSKKRGYRLFLNGLSLIQPEHLQVHLDSSLNCCHITPLSFRSLVSFHPVYHL